MNQRGWKHFGVKTLPENTYYKAERDTTVEHADRSKKARILAVMFTVLAVTLTLIYHPFFSIQTISITGVSSIPVETIREAVEQTLVGNQWHVIPKNNIFFVNHTHINQAIEHYIIPKSTTITPEWGKILSVQIVEYPVVLYWKQGNERYSINERGVITEQIPKTYTIRTDAVVIEDAGRTITIGSPIITNQQIQWLLNTSKLLRDQLQFVPKSVIVSNTHPDIVEIYFDHLKLILTFDDTPQAQISRFKVLVDSKPTLMTDTVRHSIDLRFGEKVYYH